MVLFRKGYFALLWQSVGINSCRLGPSAIPAVPPPVVSGLHLWISGAERASGKTQSLLLLKQQRQPGGGWQEITVLPCLGLGAEKHLPCELPHRIACVLKCVRAVGGNGHTSPLSGETTWV